MTKDQYWFINSSLCMCMCAHTSTCMHVTVHLEAKVVARCLPKSFFIMVYLFVCLRSLTEPEAPQYDQVGQQQTPGIMEFLPPQHWDYEYITQYRAVYVVLGI